jgi:RNAse (barnase) inhibitor barstar
MTMQGASNLAEVAWECVHFCERISLHELPDQRISGFDIFEMDAGEISTKEQLLASIAETMGFPDYFGLNWDALDECLRDMEWSPAKGYVLIIRNAENLWRKNPRVAAGLIQSWMFSAEEWSHEGVPFHLVFAW